MGSFKTSLFQKFTFSDFHAFKNLFSPRKARRACGRLHSFVLNLHPFISLSLSLFHTLTLSKLDIFRRVMRACGRLLNSVLNSPPFTILPLLFQKFIPTKESEESEEVVKSFTLSFSHLITLSNLAVFKESEEDVYEIAQFCSQLTSLYLESPTSPILSSLPHWTNVRQLKLNKVDFGEVLNALESAQLNLTSLQLVACNGILDLGR